MGMGRMGMIFMNTKREWRLPGLLYADDLVLCGVGRRPMGNGGTF